MAIVLVLVVLVAIGGGAAFFFKSKSTTSDDAVVRSDSQPRSTEPATPAPEPAPPRITTPEPQLDDLLSAASTKSSPRAETPTTAPLTDAGTGEEEGGFDRFGSPGARLKKTGVDGPMAPAGRVYDMELDPEPRTDPSLAGGAEPAPTAPVEPAPASQPVLEPDPVAEVHPEPVAEVEPASIIEPATDDDAVVPPAPEPATEVLAVPEAESAEQFAYGSLIEEPTEPSVAPPVAEPQLAAPGAETEPITEPTLASEPVAVEPEPVAVEPEPELVVDESVTGAEQPLTAAPEAEPVAEPAPPVAEVASDGAAPEPAVAAAAAAPRDAVDHVLQALISRAQERKVALAQVAAELVEQANLEDREIDEVLGDLIAVAPEEKENVDPNERLEELTMFNDAVPKRPGQINAFDQLGSSEKKRVIIRVLCLLVALQEDYKLQPSEPASEAETRSWPLARAVWPVKAKEEEDESKPIQRRKGKLAKSR